MSSICKQMSSIQLHVEGVHDLAIDAIDERSAGSQ
jgi:hypothetical protein